MINKHLKVLAYSPSQKCFHLETLEEYIEYSTLSYFNENNFDGFCMLGIFETDLQALEYKESLKKQKKEIVK